MKIKQNVLFYFGYFLLIFAEMLQTIPIVKKGQDIITLIGLISICLFDLICIIKKKKIGNIKKIASICFALSISLISYIITQDFTIIKCIVLLFSIFSFEFEKIVEWDFKIKLLLTFIVILMNAFGFTQTRVFYRLDGTTRYTLGFIHPNTLGFYTMMLVLEYFYLHRDKTSIKQYAFAIIIFLINWKVSDSRTCALIILFFILYNLIRDKGINKLINNKIIKTLITYSFLIFSLVSMVIGLLYNPDNQLMLKLNELLSLRPQNYALYLSDYPISILGNNLPESIDGKFLDNAYLLLIIKFGIIQYLGYLFLTIKAFKNLYCKKHNYLIVILLLLFLYGLMENMIIKATMNVFVLALILPLQEKVREKMEYDDKLVSIIVPIYNSEKYLRKCLDSIINQKYKNLEIILVNDGSIDSSVEICKEYETKDNRIQLISIENSGVANARNKGIDIAKGDYISFVDSDDTVDENFINIMYNSCVKHDAKICAVNVNYCYGKKIKRPIRMQNCIVEADKYYKLLLNGIKGFVSNKLYHKSLLKDVRFDEDIVIGEDLLFNVRIANKIDKAVIVNEYLYNYFQNDYTAYNSKYNMKKISEIYAYDRIIDIVEKECSDALKEYKCEYLIMAINQKNQYKNSDLNNSKIYKTIMTSMNKYYDEIIKSDEIPIIKKIYIILLDKCYKFIRLLKFIKNRVI